MARALLFRTSSIRSVIRHTKSFSSSAFSSNPSLHPCINKTSIVPPLPSKPFSNPTSHQSFNFFFPSRSHSSSPGSSNIVLIKSEEEFNSSLKRVKDDKLPAIFYFTAVWCGPCRFVSPVVEEFGKKYPHLTIYKIDIDQEGLEDTLSELNITSVPTFHLFCNGAKATEVIGADVARLKATVEKLYE
ncbi:PREDICTED: thioredoxin O2, mitochondrial isoform X2 [Nelumbo nucifera]|uniref:Thioredoxin O2, mitochondrial isoform X2 n=1 Tax=Nelumbo nucifera TaxID=4432 RepID=A0A1U8AED6_NELNU|nr:PREDICTED: thioredoxin O2, mitochondrial isoform X2 [Nelumbo nucifera]